MTRDERFRDAEIRLQERLLRPEDLIWEYEVYYGDEILAGTPPKAAHILAIKQANEKTLRINRRKKGGARDAIQPT